MATQGVARIDVVRVPRQVAEPASAGHAEQVAAALPKDMLFATPAPQPEGPARVPDAEWALTSAWSHRGRTVTGTAAVHYGAGHDRLVRPMIIADGFGHGPSDLAALWHRLDAAYPPHRDRLLGQLLAQGIDVVLLGFGARHAHIQANAGVAAACIRRAIAERSGATPLIVAGVSVGGLITRYALADMETRREDHQTATYLSYDTPHNGAWIPLILQQLAYFAQSLAPARQADLIKSAVAQQVLWAWVESARYSGPVATASLLRVEFIEDLRRVGWFPARPRKLGVANGAADGTGRNVPPDHQVFEWSALGGRVGASVRTQPERGAGRLLGGMWARPVWDSRSYTSDVPAFDGAPGGTLPAYGAVADTLGVAIDTRYRSACFVPSVSAVSLQGDPVECPADLYTDLTALSPEQSQLDDYHCDSNNTEHGSVTATLAEWILDQLAK